MKKKKFKVSLLGQLDTNVQILLKFDPDADSENFYEELLADLQGKIAKKLHVEDFTLFYQEEATVRGQPDLSELTDGEDMEILMGEDTPQRILVRTADMSGRFSALSRDSPFQPIEPSSMPTNTPDIVRPQFLPHQPSGIHHDITVYKDVVVRLLQIDDNWYLRPAGDGTEGDASPGAGPVSLPSPLSEPPEFSPASLPTSSKTHSLDDYDFVESGCCGSKVQLDETSKDELQDAAKDQLQDAPKDQLQDTSKDQLQDASKDLQEDGSIIQLKSSPSHSPGSENIPGQPHVKRLEEAAQSPTTVDDCEIQADSLPVVQSVDSLGGLDQVEPESFFGKFSDEFMCCCYLVTCLCSRIS